MGGTWVCQCLLDTVVWRKHLEKSQSHQPSRAGGWIERRQPQCRQDAWPSLRLPRLCLPGPDSQDTRLSYGLTGEALSGH